MKIVAILTVSALCEAYDDARLAFVRPLACSIYNRKMLLFSVLFLSSSWYLTKLLGSVGFILANCFNMSARIIHSIYFTNNYFRGSPYKPLKGLLPSWPVLGSFVLSWFITNYSESRLCCDQGWSYRLAHVVVGGVCLLVTGVVILLSERDLISFVMAQWRSRQKTDDVGDTNGGKTSRGNNREKTK